MVLALGLAALVAASGCGRSEDGRLIPPPPGGSGEAGAGQGQEAETRLVPIQLEAEGAPPLVLGVYDRQEELECRFLLDEAGQLRCLPHYEAGIRATTFFADAACQDRIYIVAADAAAALTGLSVPTPLPRVDCAPRRYALATLQPAPSGTARFAGAACAPVEGYQLPSADLAQLVVTSVESPERFETGQEVDGPLVADRVRVREVETSDGARFVDHLIDGQFALPCTVQATHDAMWCSPRGVGETAGMKGEDCTSNERVWRVEACEEPVSLNDVSTRFTPGATWDGPVSRLGKGCRAVEPLETPDGMSRFVEAGPQLQDYDFMAPTSWQTEGTGRLQLRGFAGADGSLVPLPSWLLWGLAAAVHFNGPTSRHLDTVSNTTCNPVRMPDGVIRCVPSGVHVAEPFMYGFADGACSEPAYLCPTYMDCSGLIVAPPSLSSESEVQVDELFVAESAPLTYDKYEDGTCVPRDLEASSIMYVLGEPYAGWDQYPALTERR